MDDSTRQPLDAPDGPGWWAFEGAIYTALEVDITHIEPHIYKVAEGVNDDGNPELCVTVWHDGEWWDMLISQCHGKWTRLYMPWEAAPAAQGEWEPVEDGQVTSFLHIENEGSQVAVFAGDDYTDWYATEDLPPDIRLCRRRT